MVYQVFNNKNSVHSFSHQVLIDKASNSNNAFLTPLIFLLSAIMGHLSNWFSFLMKYCRLGQTNNECIKACCVLGLVWLRLSFSCRSKGWSSKELILQVNSILTDVGLYFSAIKGASTCAIYSKKQRNLA